MTGEQILGTVIISVVTIGVIVLWALLIEFVNRRIEKKEEQAAPQEPPYDLEAIAVKLAELQVCVDCWKRKFTAEFESLSEEENTTRAAGMLFHARIFLGRAKSYADDAKEEILRSIESLQKYDFETVEEAAETEADSAREEKQ